MAASPSALTVLVLLLGAISRSDAGLPAAAPAVSGAWDGFSPLAGVWKGVRTVREKDGCRLDDTAKVRQRVTLTVRIGIDGSPIGDLSFVNAPGGMPQQWSGWVDGDQLRFQTMQTMTCQGKTHRYPVRPTGKVPVRANGRRTTMRLVAEDGLCGCGFDVHYELTYTTAP